MTRNPCAKCEDVDGRTKCRHCGAGWYCEPCYNIHMQRNPEHLNTSFWKRSWMRGAPEALKVPLGKRYFEHDEHTKWFGYHIETLRNGKVESIIETDRFAQLVESARGQGAEDNTQAHAIFPSIVAFVGETGAGKSTIIRGLMSSTCRQASDLSNHNAPAPAPADTHRPTTGEVSLYYDPITIRTNKPVFYADSEGFGGSTPESADHQKIWHHDPYNHRYYIESRIMDRSRAVRELYPKFLYIFSDVVCMVARNQRNAADIAQKLLQWSQVAATGAINQYLLPALIIIWNATPDEKENYIKKPTQAIDDFYALLDPEIQENIFFRHLAEKIVDGPLREVKMKDILGHFFSGIRVHYIPFDGQGRLGDSIHFEDQFTNLMSHIREDVEMVQQLRQERGASLDSNQMSIVFRSAFEHLTSGKEGSFDFSSCRRQISLPSSTKDFIGTFLDVSLRGRIQENFRYSASVIASCLILEIVKSDGPDFVGTADTIMSKDITTLCRQAIETFLDSSLECDYRHPETGEACKNTRLGHVKGHQGAKAEILGSGAFQNHEFSAGAFLQTISEEFKSQLQAIRKRNRKARTRFLIQEHKRLLRAAPDAKFWMDTDERQRKVKKTALDVPCFGCLFRKPEYVLKCDHSLCQECVFLFNESNEPYPTVSILERCPFCSQGDSHSSDIDRQEISIIPKLAGVRILSLDGGGVRGIVELETLRRLEEEIGLDLPIRSFFDLIVGTSAGGLVALAIGVKRWSTQECIDDWKTLCKKSFQQKFGTKGLFGIGFLVRYLRESIYDSQAMETALQNEYGTDTTLYGLRSSAEAGLWWTTTRVALTTSVNERLRLFTNYNWGDDELYMRSRTEIWKAARATTAAPMYFLPFEAKPGNYKCYDGGLIQNNPVQTALNESKALWGKDVSVDMILSIGSGSAKERPPGLRNSGSKDSWVSKLIKTFFETMNGKRLWERFLSENHTHHARARRLNVEFDQKEEYDLDDLESIEKMQREAKKFEFRPEQHSITSYKQVLPGSIPPYNSLSEVASRLRGSLFFFQPESVAHTMTKNMAHMKGTIYCRLDPWTSSYENLARMVVCFRKAGHKFTLQDNKVACTSGEDHFTEGESARDSDLQKMMIEASSANRKSRFKYPIEFNSPTQLNQGTQPQQSLDIEIRFKDGSIAPISGFPTTLTALQSYARRYNIE